MKIRSLAACLLLLPCAWAQAVTITYSGIREDLSTAVTFAIAGGNGSGPSNGSTRAGSSLSYQDEITALAFDVDNDQGATAQGSGFARQVTLLGSTGMSSDGIGLASVQIARAGTTRGTGESNFETFFAVDEDVQAVFGAAVTCNGAGCLSKIQLFGPNGQVLAQVQTASGIENTSFQGLLLAGVNYHVIASTQTVLILGAEGRGSSGGNYSLQLSLPGLTGQPPAVPEPATGAMAGLGTAALLLWRRRRGRGG